MQTKISKLLEIKYPIIQGGMAWIADAALAAAVSNAGGLGLIAGGNAPVDVVKSEIRKVRELALGKPFGINIMLLSPNAEDLAQLAIDEKIPVVTTGAGSPGVFVKDWKAAGITVIPVVPSVALASRMERLGIDAVICEGHEAGGHIGEITTMSLVPQIVDAVSVPVIAAGGIADGRGVAAAFMLGASGVQCGTAFLAAKECSIHENYKQKIFAAKDTGTVVTGRSGGHPVRSLKTSFARKLLALEKDNIPPDELEKLAEGSLRKAAVEGDLDEGSFMCGQIAGLLSEERTCSEIVEYIFSKANELLSSGGVNL